MGVRKAERESERDSYGYFIAHPNELPHDKRKVGPWQQAKKDDERMHSGHLHFFLFFLLPGSGLLVSSCKIHM